MRSARRRLAALLAGPALRALFHAAPMAWRRILASPTRTSSPFSNASRRSSFRASRSLRRSRSRIERAPAAGSARKALTRAAKDRARRRAARRFRFSSSSRRAVPLCTTLPEQAELRRLILHAFSPAVERVGRCGLLRPLPLPPEALLALVEPAHQSARCFSASRARRRPLGLIEQDEATSCTLVVAVAAPFWRRLRDPRPQALQRRRGALAAAVGDELVESLQKHCRIARARKQAPGIPPAAVLRIKVRAKLRLGEPDQRAQPLEALARLVDRAFAVRVRTAQARPHPGDLLRRDATERISQALPWFEPPRHDATSPLSVRLRPTIETDAAPAARHRSAARRLPRGRAMAASSTVAASLSISISAMTSPALSPA